MFRFFATLLVTGVAVVATSAWWSGRDAPSQWPTLPEQPRVEPVEPASASQTPQAPKENPEKTAEPAVREPAPTSLPTIAAVAAPKAAAPKAAAPKAAAPKARAETRSVPPIPAPRLFDAAEYTRVVTPVPTLPEPIPAPFAPAAPRDDVEETRIPEPAAFEDEILELARDEETYGEENVIYVEGDGSFDGDLDELFAREAGEPFEGPDDGESFTGQERAIAMSGEDASAARIRRLLDVYESLGRRR